MAQRRQRVGLVVIGVAVALVVVAATLRPDTVAGTAHAAPVPGPPVVGDCVLDPVPGPPLESTTVTAHSGGTIPVYPAQRIGPCTADRYGEITTVIAAPKPTVVKGDNDNRYLDDPNQGSCVPPTVQYLGMTAQPIASFWQTYLRIDIALSRPSPRQQAAGQRWAACVVTLQLPQPAQATATAPATTAPRYGGSIRNALHTGQHRDQLGDCAPSMDWNGDRAVSCNQPHALEFLANGVSGDHPVPRVHIEATCRQVVHQLTGMPDPTAAGALSIEIYVQDGSGTVITTPQVPARSYLSCGVAITGHRKLGGSLLALGRQAIPWVF